MGINWVMLLLALNWAQMQSIRSQVEPVTDIQESGCTRARVHHPVKRFQV